MSFQKWFNYYKNRYADKKGYKKYGSGRISDAVNAQYPKIHISKNTIQSWIDGINQLLRNRKRLTELGFDMIWLTKLTSPCL